MDLADRYHLKRKCQYGDVNDLYSHFPDSSIKRPLYDLNIEQNLDLSTCVMSHENGSMINPPILPSKDEMFMIIENGRQTDVEKTPMMADDFSGSIKSTPHGSLISSCSPHDSIGHSVTHEQSSANEISSVQKSPLKSQDCSECLAGKSGHIHHIGRWKLIDSPDGFCQL